MLNLAQKQREIEIRLGEIEKKWVELNSAALLDNEGSDDSSRKSWQRTAYMIWDKIADHRAGNAFLKLPKTQDYSQAIKYPMSLEMVKQRIRSKKIKTTAEFHRDVMLCLANAVAYDGEVIQAMALELMAYTDSEMQNFLILHP